MGRILLCQSLALVRGFLPGQLEQSQAAAAHARGRRPAIPSTAQGIYLYDRFGNLELLHRDPAISSMMPIPIQQRPEPRGLFGTCGRRGPQAGSVVLQDIYRGLPGIERGAVKRLRIVGVYRKCSPT